MKITPHPEPVNETKQNQQHMFDLFENSNNESIKKLYEWIRDIFVFAPVEFVEVINISDVDTYLRVQLYTSDNLYSITLNKNYLGCMVSNRKSYPGESWERGRDLPDGEFNKETWYNILNKMFGCELKELFVRG
jgi:hypothetical protein